MRFPLSKWLAGLLIFAGTAFAAGRSTSLTAVPASQSAPVSTEFSVNLDVIVRDVAGKLVPGISVTYSSPSTGAGGTFLGNGAHSITANSGPDGDTSVAFVANSVPGTYTVIAGILTASGALICTFSLTNIGPPAIITTLPGTTPQSALVGTAFQPLGVKITDAANYPLSGLSVKFGGPSNIPISFGNPAPVALPGGLFGNSTIGVTVVTDASGIASTPFTANSNPGAFTVTAQSGALGATFNLTNTPVSLTANPGTTPQSTTINKAFPIPLSVTVRDPSTNATVSGINVIFSASTSGPSGVFSNSTNSIIVASNAAGIASAPFTANSTSGGAYTVNAFFGVYNVAFSLTNAPAGPATLTANPGSTPQSAAPNKAFSAPLAVTVKDALSAPLSGINVTFSAPATGPSGVFSNSTTTITVATNASGIASAPFTANSIVGGPYTVTAAAGALSASFSLTNASASSAPVVTQNPSNVTVNAGSSVTFTAAATGNPAPAVQWQQSTAGSPFSDIPGAASTTLTFTAAANQDGNQYRAVFSNSVSTATTSAATLTVQNGPTIRTVTPVVPSFQGNAGFSSNMYLEIYGSNFTTITRQWAGPDFNGLLAPASLENVSVKVNGKSAFVYFISPGQININAPDDTATGPVTIQVNTLNGLSNTVTVQRARLSPSLQTTPQFNVGGKQYVVALTPDFKSFIGKPNLIAGAAFVTPKPGDTISIYALGAGPTNPATQAGIIASVNSPIALPFQLKIGGVQANTTFAGLLANTIGLYQLNVVIPQVSPGDQPIEFIVDGVPNNQNLFITIGP